MAAAYIKVFYDAETNKVTRVVSAEDDGDYQPHCEEPGERSLMIPRGDILGHPSHRRLAEIVAAVEKRNERG